MNRGQVLGAIPYGVESFLTWLDCGPHHVGILFCFLKEKLFLQMPYNDFSLNFHVKYLML